jgi:hypothetical protein
VDLVEGILATGSVTFHTFSTNFPDLSTGYPQVSRKPKAAIFLWEVTMGTALLPTPSRLSSDKRGVERTFLPRKFTAITRLSTGYPQGEQGGEKLTIHLKINLPITFKVVFAPLLSDSIYIRCPGREFMLIKLATEALEMSHRLPSVHMLSLSYRCNAEAAHS